ncbi:unnamed protein product [Oikopleura dioica]|uniref:Transmembrane protein n=1 Tax=Oikopleura dioica TaxID=34765 RepID=E4YIS0_OIKDI|nr:unnamed protein product [Oikopleura dioica]
MHDNIKFKTKSGSGIVFVSILMLIVTSWLFLATITNVSGEKICFAVVGGLILSICGFVVGLAKNCKERRSEECFTKFDFSLMMVLTAATILFIIFWIHQYFQLGVPDDALFFLRTQLILGLLYLPIIGAFFMRTCCDDGMSNKPSTEEILAEYGRVGGRKHSMDSFSSRTKLTRSSSS